ncbi:Phenol 2-monooxygenase [Hypsizygus marmoreus]|uniref:Phenol 2-monooxygenase n=1 Tax=Hypsizygus marmoreus TaxID=39966 RepID=A0A369J4K7_HYPMA|nr:Phenol 2-monooxygenase [Hypsizygus marmoreus]
MPISAVKESNIDVLVIGAGPAGLMACNALARTGINVRIVDKQPSKVMAGQADGIQPRTIEVLQSYGLAQRLLQEANQVHTAAFYNPNPETRGIELTDRTPGVFANDARYPFEATLHQGAIEDIFLDSMRDLGVEVSRPTVPVSIQVYDNQPQSVDASTFPVRVVLFHGDARNGQTETEIVHAKFVIGADGAHSWVRKACDIEMEGEQTEYIWGVVDMVPETDFPDIRNKCAIHSINGSCGIVPREGDKVRLYIQLGSHGELDDTSGRVAKELMGPNMLLDVARKSMFPYVIDEAEPIEWWTIYRIGQRVAAQFFVKDRIFIAGDACHTHSPKAGQGMDASMNDTHNLAWKLVHVVKGWADLSLLRTYEFERRTYAQDLIIFDKQWAELFSGRPRTDDNQGGVSHEDFLKAFKAFGGFTSGIGICYAESELINTTHQSFTKNLIIGKRLPPQIVVRAADLRPFELQDLLPSDARFKVLVFAGDTIQPSQRMRLTMLAEEMGAGASFLKTYSHGENIFAAFDILVVGSSKGATRHTDFPELFRSHWSKVFVNRGMEELPGCDVYGNFGINPAGAVVIVRPDGYVGTVAPFEMVGDINRYFAAFTRPSTDV